MGDLPPLPTIVTKVLQITGDVNGNASDLERYVTMDQSLATKMLRVVNSPYFGISGQVSSISHAIVILGFNQIRNLVLSVGANGMFGNDNARAQPVHHYFWKHSMATAAAASSIAKIKKLSSKDSELVFVSAMIANLGCLFLLKHLTLPYLQVFDRFQQHGQATLGEFEKAIFGMSHADVSLQLSKAWSLPEDLGQTLSLHEGPFADESNPVPMCIHIADRIATMALLQMDRKGEILNCDPVALNWLGAGVEQIELLKAEAKLRLEDSADMLDSLAA